MTVRDDCALAQCILNPLGRWFVFAANVGTLLFESAAHSIIPVWYVPYLLGGRLGLLLFPGGFIFTASRVTVSLDLEGTLLIRSCLRKDTNLWSALREGV